MIASSLDQAILLTIRSADIFDWQGLPH